LSLTRPKSTNNHPPDNFTRTIADRICCPGVSLSQMRTPNHVVRHSSCTRARCQCLHKQGRNNYSAWPSSTDHSTHGSADTSGNDVTKVALQRDEPWSGLRKHYRRAV